MLPSRCQLLIKGPKTWCSRNQLFMRSEDRANAYAATNRNGVVGNKGSTTPTAPMATAARPTNNQMNRALKFIPEVHHKTTGSGKSGGSRWRGDILVEMKRIVFYLGLALLFTHELDAMSNHEWQVLPLLSDLTDSVARQIFVIAHVPIFAVVIACIASLNLKTRAMARDIASGFLIAHALLHFAFSGHAAYQFSSSLSSMLIFGAGVCGLLYFLARFQDQ